MIHDSEQNAQVLNETDRYRIYPVHYNTPYNVLSVLMYTAQRKIILLILFLLDGFFPLILSKVNSKTDGTRDMYLYVVYVPYA